MKRGVFSGPYFPVFALNMEIYGVNSVQIGENTARKNSVYGHFSHSVIKKKPSWNILFLLSVGKNKLMKAVKQV